MQSELQIVSLVEDKLKVLLENYNFLKQENEFLHKKIAEAAQQLEERKHLIEQKEENLKTLKIAKTIEGSIHNTKETKLKINMLIREIDKCIVQLSE